MDTHNVLLVAPSAGADKEAIHPQIVSTFIHEPPNVPPPVPLPFTNPVSGVYTVEVTSAIVTTNDLLQLPAQPFALVFVGSGCDIRFTRPLPVLLPFY